MPKTFLILILALPVGGILQGLEKYVFSDWEYLNWLIILMAGDTCLGFYSAWKNKRIESAAFYQVVEKVAIYFSILVVCHILADFTISGKQVGVFGFAKYLGFSALIVKESISIMEHLTKINKSLVPAWLLRRLKHYDKTGRDEK